MSTSQIKQHANKPNNQTHVIERAHYFRHTQRGIGHERPHARRPGHERTTYMCACVHMQCATQVRNSTITKYKKTHAKKHKKTCNKLENHFIL